MGKGSDLAGKLSFTSKNESVCFTGFTLETSGNPMSVQLHRGLAMTTMGMSELDLS